MTSKSLFARIGPMVESFFRKWYLTRQLYRYIFKEGNETRIRDGVKPADFLEWYKWRWEGWRRKDFPKRAAKEDRTFEETAIRTIDECEKIDYIERTGNNIRVGHRGRQVYVWYYPLVAPFNNLYVKAVVISVIVLWTTYGIEQILRIPLSIVWRILSFMIKAVIYVIYFFPVIGARILQLLYLWPTLWPFGGGY